MPKTYPVKGKVVFKGGKPVRGGLIEFQSKSDPKVRATGEIQSDGTFSLTTYLEGKQAAGAVEGQHGVIVEPLAAKEGEPPIVLPQPYMVEPRDNEITIEISRPRP